MNTSERTNIIWTIGHSTRPLEEFIEILRSFHIELLVDIRSLPGSRRYPHFNKEALQESLPQQAIHYIHVKELGGRRKVKPGSLNTGWRLDAFRGYADYMETNEFKQAIGELERIALQKRTSIMCAEAVWWRCHRSLVSDYLKVQGWTVLHIMDSNKVQEHPFTAPAKVTNGHLTYPGESL
jgi:uncharacterized protein (DUF488 family)